MIDRMINLPYTLEDEFTEALAACEEAKVMPYIVVQAVMNLFIMGLSDEQIAQSFQISVEDVQAIKQQNQH